MTRYEEEVGLQLQFWQYKMKRKASLANRLSKNIQNKINGFIPDKVHHAITVAIEKMVKAVLFGAKHTTFMRMDAASSLFLQEANVKQKIAFYQKTATVEGAVTGAGGILLGLADFPLLLGIKVKMLFEIAALYGYDVKDYRERLYILHIFQLAFSSQQRRNQVYRLIENWEDYSHSLPGEVDQFDWRTFQQEYRDYIDLAKMAQLVPVIGAAVGAVANYRLVALLGDTAMNCYRMRKIPPLTIKNP